jgi:hypothetical protein
MGSQGTTKCSRLRRMLSLVDASYEVSSVNAHARSLSGRSLAHRRASKAGSGRQDLGPNCRRSASSGGTKPTKERFSHHKPSARKSL